VKLLSLFWSILATMGPILVAMAALSDVYLAPPTSSSGWNPLDDLPMSQVAVYLLMAVALAMCVAIFLYTKYLSSKRQRQWVNGPTVICAAIVLAGAYSAFVAGRHEEPEEKHLSSLALEAVTSHSGPTLVLLAAAALAIPAALCFFVAPIPGRRRKHRRKREPVGRQREQVRPSPEM